MIKAIKYLPVILCCLIGIYSCSKTPKATAGQIVPPSKLRIDQICQSYIRGDYKNLLSMVYNYKDKTGKYQQQLTYMLMHHETIKKRDSLTIAAIEPSKVIMSHSNRIAEVYCDISYENGNKEEIFLPMIYAEGKWWIK